jgi:hypothetical protein
MDCAAPVWGQRGPGMSHAGTGLWQTEQGWTGSQPQSMMRLLRVHAESAGCSPGWSTGSCSALDSQKRILSNYNNQIGGRASPSGRWLCAMSQSR